jgi:hypothetical protein
VKAINRRGEVTLLEDTEDAEPITKPLSVVQKAPPFPLIDEFLVPTILKENDSVFSVYRTPVRGRNIGAWTSVLYPATVVKQAGTNVHLKFDSDNSTLVVPRPYVLFFPAGSHSTQ